MSYFIANFDHLPSRGDVTISVWAEPDKLSKNRTILKAVLHSKENKVIVTLNEDQAERLADLLDVAINQVEEVG